MNVTATQGNSCGVVGLGVMGGNLARNMAGHGITVIGYDQDESRARAFRDGPARGTGITLAESLEALVAGLPRPRRVLLMVPAGAPVDAVIGRVRPLLESGDVLIDAGNSFFLDTERRSLELEATGIHFVGMGVSGGEEGALRGPAIMVGGSPHAWSALAPALQAIAARADDGDACVGHMGPRGAGHYVKMVHNAIEYGDMQLIAEAYDLLRRGAGLSAAAIADLFAEWNRGELRSYLIEITADVLRRVDVDTGRPLVDAILDEAQQKGTGKWASQHAFDVGAPIPTINAAVEARLLSAMKQERVAASRWLRGPSAPPTIPGDELARAVRGALHASRITSYAQGLALVRQTSAEYGYGLRPADIARVWRAGCIIRAALLGDIRDAFARNGDLANLLLDEAFRAAVHERQDAWRAAVRAAVALGIPVPAMCASLAYFDAYRSATLPANLTQAQRDYFGAHTYRRVDRDGVFHTQWTEPAGARS